MEPTPSMIAGIFPANSTSQSFESECVAHGIAIFLSETGNVFRLASIDEFMEYAKERGHEVDYVFKQRFSYFAQKLASAETAAQFCQHWRKSLFGNTQA